VLIASMLIMPATAQTPQANGVTAVDLSDVADGQYVLTVSGSQITLVPLTLIKPDVTPPNPPDPDLNARAKAFKAATVKIIEPKKSETQEALSLLYSQLSQAVLDNNLADYSLIASLVKQTEKQVLDRQGSATAWKPVTDLTSSELAKVAATSGTSAKDYADCLADAADGLSSNEKLDPVWIELIMMIIKLILERLLPAAGAVVP